jgi:hypothetical protein
MNCRIPHGIPLLAEAQGHNKPCADDKRPGNQGCSIGHNEHTNMACNVGDQ